MNEKDIISFKQTIENLSAQELQDKKTELETQLTKMVLDSDLFVKIALVEALIKGKK